jgi:hypothetical protein
MKKHKYYGLISNIDTTKDSNSPAHVLRPIVGELLRDIEDSEADFDMMGNLHVFSSFYRENKDLNDALSTIIELTEYNALVYFEVLCLLKPLTDRITTEFRDIVYLKNAGLVANSWYESLSYHYGVEFRNSLDKFPKYRHNQLRQELRRAFRAGKRFQEVFGPVRNEVLAHRRVSIGGYLHLDGRLFDSPFIECLIEFLYNILQLKALTLDLALDCAKIMSANTRKIPGLKDKSNYKLRSLNQLELHIKSQPPHINE